MNGQDVNVLHLVMNGQVIGDIQRTGRRRMRLRYAPEQEVYTPLSVSMPGAASRYREKVLEPWLSGLLPDRPETVRQWRRQFGLTDSSVFALLGHVGEDVAGAAQFVRPERLDSVLATAGDLKHLEDGRISDMLRRALADLPVSAADHSRGKFSLAGAQAKIALHRTSNGWSDPSGSVPSTHIVKPAIPGRTDQDLVEAVTLRAAANLGLRAAACSVDEFEDERALVVSRFDRVQDGHRRWARVHQEDMAQGLSLWPQQKYESQGGPRATTVAGLVRRVSREPEEDCRRFAQALVFNWLTLGTDAHARNYALLLSGPAVRLAPLYDLNSFLGYSDGSGADLSMSVGGEFRAGRIAVADWTSFAPALQVGADWLRDEIERQREGMLQALRAAAGSHDVARFDSPVVDRLLANATVWLNSLRA